MRIWAIGSRSKAAQDRRTPGHSANSSLSGNFQFSVFNFQLSTFNFQLSIPAALLLLLSTLFALPLHAASPGSEVIIIYNTRVPESKAVAEYYARKRIVPEDQVFGFSLAKTENMSREEFQDKLQKPLFQKLEKSKLWEVATEKAPATSAQAGAAIRRVVQSKVRYAVLCYGVPLRIDHDAACAENVEKMRPEMRRNGAAVDNELALLPVLPQKPLISGPIRNMLYGVTNAAWFTPTNGLLMVTRLDGPTQEIARGLVDKAILAEAVGLNGRAYIDLRNITDPTYKPGDDWLRSAGEICRRLGFETVVDQGPNPFPAGFPLSQIAIYMGWYAEHVCGPFTLPEVEFMPGAFAYHLHSFSANTLHSTNQFWAGPLLAKGAACVLGSVDEPYLNATPEMSIFTARFFYSAMTFGEAAYASMPALSWQITCLGDPLYRPSGKNPDQLIAEAEAKPDGKPDWSYLRLVNANLASGKPLPATVTFLEELPLTKSSAVLTEKLGDLYAALGKPSSAVYEYQRALKLDASLQQRVRLLLTLADKLSALDRKPEAAASLKQLLADFPDYPDKKYVRKQIEGMGG